MKLSELKALVPEAQMLGAGDPELAGMTQDSRRVGPGWLFVARKGTSSDGIRFIPQAISAGASAILIEHGSLGEKASSLSVPVLSAPELPKRIGVVAHAIYGYPTRRMRAVGITGTNGKTTSSFLLRAAIDGALNKTSTAIVGTLGCFFGDYEEVLEHTTPEADAIARLLRQVADRGASHVAMEVSSIALEVGRVNGCEFEVAGFTNFTQDHLDFHGSMQAYREAKERLFFDGFTRSGVFCVDHLVGREIADRFRLPKRTVSVRDKADLTPEAVTFSSEGIDATIHAPRGAFRLRSPLVGEHNLENLLVVLGSCDLLGLDLQACAEGLRNATGAPGRLEVVDPASSVKVLVDYAHTPDALERALHACRRYCKGKLWCVFGCGGDRDPTKRIPMGRAVGTFADVGIVTSDNPRTEDPKTIVDTVEQGISEKMKRAENWASGSYQTILDRAEAIEVAISNAAPGDWVLIAGKGHETYQIIGKEKRHFDDREVAKASLNKRTH